MADQPWYKDPNYGKLEQKAKKGGVLGAIGAVGTELAGAASFTANYWKKKLKGAKDAVTIEPRDTLGRGTRSQLEKLDNF